MSFGFQATIRDGSWRVFRHFILHEMRDAAKRIESIDAQLARIGRFTILYQTEEREPNVFVATERRIGLTVTAGTTMEKLLQAYIASGGNPFDISLFSYPDETVQVTINEESVTFETTPYGGVTVPLGVDMASDGPYDAGWLPNLKYLPRRLGGDAVIWSAASQVISAVDTLRSWARQEIREKRNNIEARILKQFDLREQLLYEKNELIASAVGGSVEGVQFINDYHARSNRIQSLIQVIDSQFYGEVDGLLNFDVPQTIGRAYTRFKTLYQDLPEEKWSAL